MDILREIPPSGNRDICFFSRNVLWCKIRTVLPRYEKVHDALYQPQQRGVRRGDLTRRTLFEVKPRDFPAPFGSIVLKETSRR